jgi:hypothetical protein
MPLHDLLIELDGFLREIVVTVLTVLQVLTTQIRQLELSSFGVAL